MSEKHEPLTLLKGYITEESIQEGKPEYIIETEFEEWCKLHTTFFLQRYKEGKGKHWTNNEIRTTNIGMAGHRAFQKLLDKMEVAYVPNDPMLDERQEKNYDFLIPQLGKTEVKTVDHYCEKVLIKTSEWHGNAFLVVWQIDQTEQHLKMKGWLTKDQVEAYPDILKGKTKYNPYSTAKIIDLSDLNNSETFLTKLTEAKAKMFSTGKK